MDVWILAQVFTADWAMELVRHIPVLVARTLITFITVVMVVRWTGKRSIANLAPFDLTMVIMIGEVAAIPVADLEVDMLHGVLPVVLLGGLHVLITTVAILSKRFERWTEGAPTLLIKDGKVLMRNLRRERVSMADLMTALRLKEISHPSEVKEAWIEHAGGISVLRDRQHQAATPEDLDAAVDRIARACADQVRAELESLLRRRDSGSG
jgi:uncharacterized membrane protein YcaP (DUF421 family)